MFRMLLQTNTHVFWSTLAEGHVGSFQNDCSILIAKQNSLNSNFKNKTL